MIIVKLVGGLGNQLSQYAFAKSVASKIKTSFLLDIREYNLGKTVFDSQDFLLDKFNIKELKIATDEQIEKIIRIPITKRLYNKILPFHQRHFVSDSGKGYNPLYMEVDDNTYFEGFWLSEKYYLPIRPILLDEFTLTETYVGENGECKKAMESSNSIAVHIRRGDFVTDQAINLNHGVCSISYYEKAIEYMKSRVTNPKWFFFSDEIEWVKSHFCIYNSIHIDWNGKKKPHFDLMLMSHAKHNIIANSVFSWWSAWLNQSPNKIVIAPKKWNTNPILQLKAKDKIPNSWIRL